MRSFLMFTLLLFSAAPLLAQSARRFNVMIAAGLVNAGVDRPCEGNEHGFIGVYPRYGASLYAFGILEKWGAGMGDKCVVVLAPGTENGLAGPEQPGSRIGIGAGFDIPVEDIYLTLRVAGGRLSNSALWYSGGAGFRYSKFFVQAEYGRDHEAWTTSNGAEITRHANLTSVSVGLLF